MIRLIIIFLILLLGVIYSSDSFKAGYEYRRKQYIQIIIFILILHSGLRNWAVGSDTYRYSLIFKRFTSISWDKVLNSFTPSNVKDPFYGVFMKCLQVFSTDYQLYLFLVAIISMTSLGYFIFRNTSKIRHAVLAFVIYMGYFYGFFSITGIRQTIATAFLLWSFEYVKQRKLIAFILLVFIASLFHLSAVVFFPLYFIATIKRPKLILGLSIIGFPLFFIFKNEWAVFWVNIFGVEERFGTYTEQYYLGGSYILTMFNLLLAVLGFLVIDLVQRISKESYIFVNTFAVALFLLPLQWVNPSAARVPQYFLIIILVWIPLIIDSLSIGQGKNRQMLYLISIAIFITITFFSISSDEYKFFWQEMSLPYGY